MTRFSILLLACIATSACPDLGEDVVPECGEDYDIACPKGQICIDYECELVCSNSRDDCPPSQACLDGICQPYSASCGVHEDCIDDWYCSNGACAPKLLLGDGCGTSDTACLSNHCVDSYCCEDSCADTCYSCSPELTGGRAGFCEPSLEGQSRAGECDAGLGCNGSGACAYKPLGTPCLDNAECDSGECVDNVCCDSTCSGTCQSCLASETGGFSGTCAPIQPGLDPDDECPAHLACSGTTGCFDFTAGTSCTNSY